MDFRTNQPKKDETDSDEEIVFTPYYKLWKSKLLQDKSAKKKIRQIHLLGEDGFVGETGLVFEMEALVKHIREQVVGLNEDGTPHLSDEVINVLVDFFEPVARSTVAVINTPKKQITKTALSLDKDAGLHLLALSIVARFHNMRERTNAVRGLCTQTFLYAWKGKAPAAGSAKMDSLTQEEVGCDCVGFTVSEDKEFMKRAIRLEMKDVFKQLHDKAEKVYFRHDVTCTEGCPHLTKTMETFYINDETFNPKMILKCLILGIYPCATLDKNKDVSPLGLVFFGDHGNPQFRQVFTAPLDDMVTETQDAFKEALQDLVTKHNHTEKTPSPAKRVGQQPAGSGHPSKKLKTNPTWTSPRKGNK